MRNSDPDEVSNAVYQLLTKFDHTSLTYLIENLCQLQGLVTEMTKGDPSTGGDLVVRNVLPYPQSIIISNQIDTRVDETSLQDLLAESTQNETKYTVVTARQPTESALVFASDHDIGIIGVGDLVEVVLTQGAIELVVEYAKEDDQIVSTHEDLLLALDDSSQGFTDEQGPEGTATGEESAKRPRNRPISENDRLSLGLVGYDMYAPDDTVEGVLIAVKLTAKEQTEINASAFSLTFADGTTVETISEAESPLVGKLEGILQPQWAVGNVSIGASESRRYIVYVPTTTESLPETLSFKNLQLSMQPPISAQTFRGLPGSVVGILNDILGSSLTEGHEESYVSYGLDDQTGHTNREEQSVMAQNDILSISLIGYEYVEDDEFKGVLVGIELKSEDHNLGVTSDDFEFHSADQFTYSGTGPSGVDVTASIADELPQKWRTGKTSISGGGRINYLMLFPTEGRPDFSKLSYSNKAYDLVNIQARDMKEATGYEWQDTISLEFPLSEESRMQYHGALPEAVIDNIPT